MKLCLAGRGCGDPSHCRGRGWSLDDGLDYEPRLACCSRFVRLCDWRTSFGVSMNHQTLIGVKLQMLLASRLGTSASHHCTICPGKFGLSGTTTLHQTKMGRVHFTQHPRQHSLALGGSSPTASKSSCPEHAAWKRPPFVFLVAPVIQNGHLTAEVPPSGCAGPVNHA